MKKIVLVGCGNIGSRHLQAIAKIKKPLEIHVVEPNPKAIAIAKDRLSEIATSNRHTYFWNNKISELNSSSDLSIISTNSHDRADIFEQLLKLGHSEFLIEKIVCQSISEYDRMLRRLKSSKSRAWVNMVRRYFPCYQKIIGKLSSFPISVSVVAGHNGLGSNAIHFIDLMSWILKNPKIKLNGTFLQPKIYHNKRGKFYNEFAGTLMGSVKDSIISITFLPMIQLPLTINIKNDNNHFLINESDEFAFSFKGGKIRKQYFRFPNVSETTTHIVNDLIKKHNCMLPTLEESYYTHKELFKVFNSHLKKLNRHNVKLCPIT